MIEPLPPTIDPIGDELLSDAQVGRMIGVSPHAVWRYRTRGKSGVKLPSIPFGRKRVTTPACVRWWFSQLQSAELAADRRPKSVVTAEIEAECKSLGI